MDSKAEDLVDYLEGRGLFENAAADGMDLSSYWTLFKDTSLWKLGLLAASLPATAADVERVWSAASFVVEARERLSSEHLRQEVYIRWNYRALGGL